MRARRRDNNTREIEDAFRKLGCRVHATNDAWDLTVQYGGLTLLVEVKDAKRPSPPTPAQKKLNEQFCIKWVTGLDGVIESVETLKRWHRAISGGDMNWKSCSECHTLFHGERLKPLAMSRGKACRYACSRCYERVQEFRKKLQRVPVTA